MAYFRTCPYCKANLDPGELCDCQKVSEPEKPNEEFYKMEKEHSAMPERPTAKHIVSFSY